MRAFKQFLSLVLVTCMLTSMVTLVSADYAFTSDQKWDSDSGRITMVQDTGKPVDSNYTRVQDSGVDATLKDVGIDLSNKKDVTVTITGEKIADSGYTLMVYNSDSETPLYTSAVENRESNPDVKGGSDKWKITFGVSPAIIAAGTRLDVYRGEDTEPGWKIQYTVQTTEITGDQPVEIPPVLDEDTNASTIQAETVEAVLNVLVKDATSATVTVEKAQGAGDLLLDTNIFENSKFDNPSFSLKIEVTDGSSVYTWTFTKSQAAYFMALMSNATGSTVPVNATVDSDAKFGPTSEISGTRVVVAENAVPEGTAATLGVETKLTPLSEAKVFYLENGKWVEAPNNSNLEVASDRTVTFQVTRNIAEYAIVDSNVKLEEMNGPETPTTEHDYTATIAQESETVKVDETKKLTVMVQDSGKPVAEDQYTVNWTAETGTEFVKVDAQTGEVTGVAEGEATVKVTVTIGEEIVTSEPITVTVTAKDTEPETHDYTATIAQESETVKVDETKKLTVMVQDSGKPVAEDQYTVNWTAETGTEFVKVDAQTGEVTGVAEGEATVKVTVTIGEEIVTSEPITVTVTAKDTEPETHNYTVKIDQPSATVKVGEKTNLSAKVYDNEVPVSDGYTLSWTVETGKEFVTVNEKTGEVTGVAKGTATIVVTVAIGDHTVTSEPISVTVNPKDAEVKPEVKITLDKTADTIKVNETTTITATVSGAEYKDLKWSVTGDATLVSTSSDNKTVTIKGTAVGPATVTATIGDVSVSCEITVEKKASSGGPTGGSSSGGGNSGTAMPNTGSGAITTPGTGTTTPGTGSTSGNAQPQGCMSDTVGNFSIAGAYQYKLTSTNGTAPVVTVSNSNFRVVLASQNGNDYFYKVYAIGAPGQTCDVYVNGTKVSTVTASSVYGGVMSDTTAPFTVKKGGSYQFKLTASSQPTMAAGSSSFRVEYVGNSGNDWFFKVYATGNAGDGCGFYVNGAPFTVAVAHIAE